MEKKKILKLSGGILLAALGLFVGLRVVLPLTLPFLLSFLLAAVTERPACFLMEKTHLRRPLCGGLCVLGAYLILLGASFLLGRLLVQELGQLLEQLPQLARSLTPALKSLRQTLQGYIQRLPQGLRGTVTDAVDNFFKNGAGLFAGLPQLIGSTVAKIVGKVPQLFLFLVTTAVSSFMMAAQLPHLRQWLGRVLPKRPRELVSDLWLRSRSALKGWVTAELKLSAVTFGIVTAGLLLLRVSRPFLTGFLIALVDLLPVLGTGTVLLPWSLLLFLKGEYLRGTAITLLYGVAAVTKTCLEPRFLGKQMGIPPLLTLLAVYVGFRTSGFGGLILFPVGTALAVQFWRIAKKDEESR